MNNYYSLVIFEPAYCLLKQYCQSFLTYILFALSPVQLCVVNSDVKNSDFFLLFSYWPAAVGIHLDCMMHSSITICSSDAEYNETCNVRFDGVIFPLESVCRLSLMRSSHFHGPALFPGSFR